MSWSKNHLLRLREILGDPNHDPPIEPLIPLSKSAWYAGIRAGRYPKPVHLGERVSAWRYSDLIPFLSHGCEGDES
jgi:prophage regulatory protein